MLKVIQVAIYAMIITMCTIFGLAGGALILYFGVGDAAEWGSTPRWSVPLWLAMVVGTLAGTLSLGGGIGYWLCRTWDRAGRSGR